MIKKENRFFSVMMFCMIFGLLFIILAGKTVKTQIAALKGTNTSGTSNTAAIDWEELYPYDTVVEEVVPETSSADTSSGKTSAAAKIISLFSRFNTVGSRRIEKACGYSTAAKLGFVISSRLTDPGMGDVYIRLKNGSWIQRSTEITEEQAEETMAPYASLNNYLESKGITFVYFNAPDKECAVDDEYPDGFVSYTNANTDLYLKALADYGVDTVDMRETLHEAGFDHYSMFYKTDHHWTVEAGLWAASVIERELSERLDTELVDSLTVGEYNYVTYPNAEFGSMGTGVTHYVAQPEDFTIPYPEFETNYRVEAPDVGIDVTGSFKEVFVNEENLLTFSQNGGSGAYVQIMYDGAGYLKITNPDNPDGPRVLMIRDSFSRVVAPYLAQACSELLWIDTRTGAGNFKGSIISCIEQFEPDAVIVLQYTPQTLTLNK